MPLNTPCPPRPRWRAAAVVAVAASLAAGLAVPARADTARDGRDLSAAYSRAILLGRVFASNELAAAAADAVTASADPAAGAEEDIAGPPPELGAGSDQGGPSGAAGRTDASGATNGFAIAPVTGPQARADDAASGTFEMVGDDATEVDGYAPASGGSQGFAVAGVWVCPVPAWTWFTHDWGFPRSGGRTHKGNDIFAPLGTPLLAADRGVVTKVTRVDRGLGGLTVSYLTDTGLVVYNAHLDAIAAGMTPGVRVVAGQQIGTIGKSGNARSTPPHLHIGIYPASGGVIDPYPYTSSACR